MKPSTTRPQLSHSDAPRADSPLAGWLRRQRVAYLSGPLKRLADDDAVHGVICPPPLPPGLVHRDLAAHIPLGKDVDGFHPGSLPASLPPELVRPDIMLTRAATSAVAPEPVRLLAVALLLLATVNAARHQHPAVLSAAVES